MAENDEIYNVIMRVQGEDKVERLRKQIDETEESLAKLVRMQGVDAPEVKGVAGHLTNLNKELQAAEKTARSFGGNVGQGLTQLGYFVDDVQYGFKGISNNIQPVIQSLTGNAGLAGALGIAAIAGYQLYTHWDDLMGLFGSGKVRTEAEEMAELAKKTKLTADEMKRLAELKAVEKKATELVGGKTASQKQSEELATRAVVEAGMDDLRKGLAATPEGKAILDKDAAVKNAKEEVRRLEGLAETHIDPKTGDVVENRDGLWGKTVAEAKKESRGALEQAEKESLDRAIARMTLTQFNQKGPGQLEAILNKNPDAFTPEALTAVEDLHQAQLQANLTPRDRKLNQDLTEQGKINEELGKKEEEEKEKRDKKAETEREKRDKQTEMLNQQGRDNYEFMKKEEERKAEEERRDARRKADESYRSAKSENPGLDKALEGVAEGFLRSGVDPTAIEAALVDKLGGKFDPETAGRLAHEAQLSGRGNLVSDFLRGEKPEKSSSATFGVAEFADAIQSGVNNNKQVELAEKQLQEFQRANELLQMLASKDNRGARPN